MHMRFLASVLVFVGLCASSFASTIVNSQPIVGPDGVSRFNGTIFAQLQAPAINTTNGQFVVPSPVMITVVNGNILGAPTMIGNDVLSPKQVYVVDYMDTFQATITRSNWYVSGATFDVGAPPTPILSNFVQVLDVTGLRNMTSANGSIYNQNSGGTIYLDTNGQYTTWAQGLAACGTGCIIDATSRNAPLAMGTFDVGTRHVVIKFAPATTYTAVNIVLRVGIQMLGAGGASSGAGTVIQSIGGNTQPLLTIPATNNVQVFNFKIDGIRFLGAAGNTSQDGLFADVSSCTNCNFNYGELSNLWFLGFVGDSIHLKGRVVDANSANQFLTFRNVNAIRPSGVNPVLKIEGYAGQINFDQCEFDGSAFNDGGDNIYLGNSGGTNTQGPNTIYFNNLTSQAGTNAIHCDGCQSIDIRMHSEGTPGVLLVTRTSTGVGVTANPGIHLHDSLIASTSGVNGGNGFIVNIGDTAIKGARVIFDNNFLGGNPDSIIKCANSNSCVVMGRYNFAAVSPSGVAPTTNMTPALAPAATLDVSNYSHILLTNSATVINTLQGNQLPGETITFIANGGTVSFGTGGNLILGSNTSPIVCPSGDSITFTRADLGATWFVSAASPGCMNAFKGSITGSTVGGGSTLNLFKIATDTPGAITINTLTCTDRAVTISGLLTSAVLYPTANYAMEANIQISPGQAVAGTGHYRICNFTAANITLNAAATFNLAAWQ